MKKLKIKSSEDIEEEGIIALERWSNCVTVKIDGIIMATFFDDGKFVFHGQGRNKFVGNWQDEDQ